MILTLHIHKEESAHYIAQVLDGQIEIDDFSAESIAVAIQDAASGGYDAKGFHIWYGHVSIGTKSISSMLHNGDTLADQLVGLCVEFLE